MTPDDIKNLKPLPWIDKYALKQLKAAHIFYKRRGYYAHCKCSECGSEYELRTVSTGDPFVDNVTDIEKPERDRETRCRVCGIKADYKPAGCFATEYYQEHIVVGRKLSESEFVFRIYYATKKIYKNCRMFLECKEFKRIYLQKGKKPVRFAPSYYDHGTWWRDGSGDTYAYKVHPSTFREIAKCEMFKYVPVSGYVTKRFYRGCWLMDYYIAAARYPDMEMIVKLGLDKLAYNLVTKIPINFNPRGREIHDRLRINKERLKALIETNGSTELLKLFQFERKLGQHWDDEELEIANALVKSDYYATSRLEIVTKHSSLKKLKNYFCRQGIYFEKSIDYGKASQIRGEYFDYLRLRASLGYDLGNEIYMYPKDIHRRHNEMVLESEKERITARQKEVLEKYPGIRKKFARLSKRYSAASDGYLIRPARDAAEIISEGRILHHCVGRDSYLSGHDSGKSFILFLRKASDPETPFITIEIKDERIVQWYGAYDEKPDEKYFDEWLNTYIDELKKRKTLNRKSA